MAQKGFGRWLQMWSKKRALVDNKQAFLSKTSIRESPNEKSHKAMGFFHVGGGGDLNTIAQLYSTAFGGVFADITEVVWVMKIAKEIRIHPPKVIT